jgi:hypothetical protein
VSPTRRLCRGRLPRAWWRSTAGVVAPYRGRGGALPRAWWRSTAGVVALYRGLGGTLPRAWWHSALRSLPAHVGERMIALFHASQQVSANLVIVHGHMPCVASHC